ncbi:MAG: hypothetical protein ABMA64_23715 [Myxococcota bacterium]
MGWMWESSWCLEVAPAYLGWLVFWAVSQVLVQSAPGRWCRAGSFGLLFGPSVVVGCGVGLAPSWLGLAQALQPGPDLVDRLCTGGLAAAGACLAAALYLGCASVGRQLLSAIAAP